MQAKIRELEASLATVTSALQQLSTQHPSHPSHPCQTSSKETAAVAQHPTGCTR